MTWWQWLVALEVAFIAGFVACALWWGAAARRRRTRERAEYRALLGMWEVLTEEERPAFGLPPLMTDEQLVGKTPKELEWLLIEGRITVNQCRRAMGIWPEAPA